MSEPGTGKLLVLQCDEDADAMAGSSGSISDTDSLRSNGSIDMGDQDVSQDNLRMPTGQ
jgi:hypothetical protein